MHTLSSVNFGQRHANGEPVQSTTMDTYLPVTTTRPSSFAPVKDSIPFDYTSGTYAFYRESLPQTPIDEPNYSTAQSSYQELVPDHTDRSHYANVSIY